MNIELKVKNHFKKHCVTGINIDDFIFMNELFMNTSTSLNNVLFFHVNNLELFEKVTYDELRKYADWISEVVKKLDIFNSRIICVKMFVNDNKTVGVLRPLNLDTMNYIERGIKFIRDKNVKDFIFNLDNITKEDTTYPYVTQILKTYK